MIYARAGQSREWNVYGAPTGLTAEFSIEDGQGATVTAAVTTGIVESPTGSGSYTVTFTAPDGDIGDQYVLVFDDTSGGVSTETLEITSTGLDTLSGDYLATVADIEARLGVTFTATQSAQAESALGVASELVAAELDKTVDEIDPVSDLIRHVTVTVALRVYGNPSGYANESERLGEYQHTRGYQGGGNLELTQTERLLIRRAYYGASSGSSFPESNVDEVYDYLYS